MGHDHRQYLTKLLQWAGCVIKFSQIVDAADRCAASRPRWLALAVRFTEDTLTAKEFTMWTSVAGVSPAVMGAILDLDWTNDQRLWPNQEVLKKASNPAFSNQ